MISLITTLLQACGDKDAYSVDYALRVRFCGECYAEK